MELPETMGKKYSKSWFGGMMTLFFYITYIHSIIFIQLIHPSSFAEVPLHQNQKSKGALCSRDRASSSLIV